MEMNRNLSRLIRLLRPDMPLPDGTEALWRLYRSLVNTQLPGYISEEFLCLQDEVLQAIRLDRGVVHGHDIPAAPLDGRLALWKGDITRLSVDAIVNAANERLLGCFVPCHACIDNAIHTYAGVQFREACNALMEAQDHDEPVGQAKLTLGFNLSSRYVLHTVGPTITSALTERDCEQLASCYTSCLALASQNGLSAVAFCCISTGLYHFPKPEAARIAIAAVRSYLDSHTTSIQKVIFNVYEESDSLLYHERLGFPEQT